MLHLNRCSIFFIQNEENINRNFTKATTVDIQREIRLISLFQCIYVILKIRQNRSCIAGYIAASLCQKLIDRM